MQELNREANTLSSKSQDLETTRSAVDMKVAHRADARAGAERRVTAARAANSAGRRPRPRWSSHEDLAVGDRGRGEGVAETKLITTAGSLGAVVKHVRKIAGIERIQHRVRFGVQLRPRDAVSRTVGGDGRGCARISEGHQHSPSWRRGESGIGDREGGQLTARRPVVEAVH